MVFALENNLQNVPCYLFIDSWAKASGQAGWYLAVEWLDDQALSSVETNIKWQQVAQDPQPLSVTYIHITI